MWPFECTCSCARDSLHGGTRNEINHEERASNLPWREAVLVFVCALAWGSPLITGSPNASAVAAAQAGQATPDQSSPGQTSPRRTSPGQSSPDQAAPPCAAPDQQTQPGQSPDTQSPSTDHHQRRRLRVLVANRSRPAALSHLTCGQSTTVAEYTTASARYSTTLKLICT